MRAFRTPAWILALLLTLLPIAQGKVIYAYVAVNGGIADRVPVINTGNNKVVKTVPLGLGQSYIPNYVAVNPAGSLAYAVSCYVEIGKCKISVISTSTNSVVATFPGKFSNIAFAPNGKTAYVPGGDDVGVINMKTMKGMTPLVSESGQITSLAVTPDGKFVYALGTYLTVSVVSTVTKQTVTTIDLGVPAGSYPSAIAISPDGSTAYATYWDPLHPQNQAGVQVIDTASNTIVNSINLNDPTSATVSPNGLWVYVLQYPNSFSIIDTGTQTVNTYPSEYSNLGVAFTPNSAFAYITNNGTNCLTALNTATLTATCIDVGFYPVSVGVMGAP